VYYLDLRDDRDAENWLKLAINAGERSSKVEPRDALLAARRARSRRAPTPAARADRSGKGSSLLGATIREPDRTYAYWFARFLQDQGRHEEARTLVEWLPRAEGRSEYIQRLARGELPSVFPLPEQRSAKAEPEEAR
jgi:hypothetical protein